MLQTLAGDFSYSILLIVTKSQFYVPLNATPMISIFYDLITYLVDSYINLSIKLELSQNMLIFLDGGIRMFEFLDDALYTDGVCV